MARWGATTARTVGPSGGGAPEVFAYLHAHDLPVPRPTGTRWAGCSIGCGSHRLLGGARGAGHGRPGWEGHYYDAALRAAGAPTTTDDDVCSSVPVRAAVPEG